MNIADQWRGDVDARIHDTLAETAQAIAPIGPAATDLTEVITSAAAGGKRLRAILTLASHAGYGGDSHDQAVKVAAAIELFQTAALLHDDVLDDSDTRRGRPAAHRTLAALHADHGWHGSSKEFGSAGAILAGDIVLMACQRALHHALEGMDNRARTRVAAFFTEMTELVTAGQYLDMRIAASPLDTLSDQETDIRATMRTKTASYSAEFPLALGAAAAGASADAITTIREVGVPLGVAFQLRDDVLGVTGSPAVTGKPAGDDIREGKRTLIAWRAWRAASADQRTVLSSTLGNRNASDAAVARVVELFESTGALAATEREIDSLATGALNALTELKLQEPGASLLVEAFTAATSRTS